MKIVSNKDSYIAPKEWKMGDPPIISDRYFNPSRVTINVGDTSTKTPSHTPSPL